MNSRIALLSVSRIQTVPEPAFVACPPALAGCCAPSDAIREVYRQAYEKALEINRPSRWAPLYVICEN
jgi:hypothetical protein